MLKNNLILTINDFYSACGGAIAVVGEVFVHQIKVNDNVLIVSDNITEFYAKIIQIKVDSKKRDVAYIKDIAHLVLSDFEPNQIKKGMKVYRTSM